MTEDIREYDSLNPDETFELGRSIGRDATPGTVIAMFGDLGAGKTLLTQGIASGLDITEPVNSPTFTIMQIYDSGRLILYHYDAYRIDDPDEMEEVGFDDFIYGPGVSVIEWADRIRELMPEHYMSIEITRDDSRGFDYRHIKVTKI